MPESMGGPLHPQAPNQLHDRFTYHSVEDAVEVVGGEVGKPGKLDQRQGMVQMPVNVLEHGEDSSPVILLGTSSHERRFYAESRPHA